MKTSEFKEIITSNAFYIDEDGLDLAIMSPTGTLAMIDKKESSRFQIIRPTILGNEAINVIIEYARTPIDEREEQYISVDIPLSDWEKINSGLTFRRDDDNKNYGIMHFFENEGFDAMFDTLRLIQSRYEHEYQK